MHNNRSHDRRGWGKSTWAALALVCAAGACSDEPTVATVDYLYEDPYTYDYYYTADLSYSGYYWADPWDYGAYVYQTNGNEVPTNPATLGGVLRQLARGEQVCPGQVTITQHTAAPVCATSSAASIRSGATIAFNGCHLSDGPTLTGTFDVTAMRTASDATCSSGTTITLVATNTITNLTITAANGARVVIPSMKDTLTGTRPLGSLPGSVGLNSQGRFQMYNSAGVLLADHNIEGTRTIVYSAADRSYSISGTINTQDNQAGGTATLMGTNVTRSSACCRPTSGTLAVNRTGGLRPGQHTWTFGPSCGQATWDGSAVTLPACQ